MYSIKFENSKYTIINPDGTDTTFSHGLEKYAQIMLESLNTKYIKHETTIKGVMDNRHRNWKRRG